MANDHVALVAFPYVAQHYFTIQLDRRDAASHTAHNIIYIFAAITGGVLMQCERTRMLQQ